jgi:hypothetical protein
MLCTVSIVHSRHWIVVFRAPSSESDEYLLPWRGHEVGYA